MQLCSGSAAEQAVLLSIVVDKCIFGDTETAHQSAACDVALQGRLIGYAATLLNTSALGTLNRSIELGQVDIAQLLLDAGASPLAVCWVRGLQSTPLHRAIDDVEEDGMCLSQGLLRCSTVLLHLSLPYQLWQSV